MTELPEPLTPADCDLHGMPFMPLEVARVMQSTTFAKSTGDEFKAAFALWCASWVEVPAASLPDDDEMLEFLSRSKNWKKVKAKALRGWILCSDGRLYHSVVAKNALEAWDRRLDYQESSNNKNERQKRWRERCKQLSDQLRALGITAPRGTSLEVLEQMLRDASVDGKASTNPSTEPSTGDGVEIGKTGTGTGTETGTVKGQGQGLTTSVPDGTGDEPPPGLTANDALFQVAVPWLVANGAKETSVRSLLGGAIKQIGAQAAWQLASQCMREKPMEPVAWIAGGLNDRIARLKGGSAKGKTLTEQQQASTEEARKLLFGNKGEVIDA